MRICFVKNKLNKLRIGLKHKLARNKDFIADRYATVGGSKNLCSFDISSKVPNPSSNHAVWPKKKVQLAILLLQQSGDLAVVIAEYNFTI